MLRISVLICALFSACPARLPAEPECPIAGRSASATINPAQQVVMHRHCYSELVSPQPGADLEACLSSSIAFTELGRFEEAKQALSKLWETLIRSDESTRRTFTPWLWFADGKLLRFVARTDPNANTRANTIARALELVERAAEHLDHVEPRLELVETLLDRFESDGDYQDLDRAASLYETVARGRPWPVIATTGCRLFRIKGWKSRLLKTAGALARTPTVDPISYAWGQHYLAELNRDRSLVAPARRHDLEALRAVETIRAGIDGRHGDSGLVRQFEPIFDRAIVSAYDAGDAWFALEIAENSRPRFSNEIDRLPDESACRAGIPADSVLLVVYATHRRADFRVFAWAITATELRAHSTSIDADMVSSLIHGSDRATPLRRFHDRVIAPTIDGLSASRLFLAPHGDLRRIPYDALNDGRTYLVERFLTTHVDHVVAPPPSNALQPGPLLVLLDPAIEYDAADQRMLPRLASASSEAVRHFAEKTTRQHRVLTDRTATAAALIEHGPSSRIIHIASHGEFDHSNPWRSSLYLAGVESDGRLSAERLRTLPLQDVDLLVLSGCETGLGDGLAGLPRASLEAGVSQLIATITPVEDSSTARFMTRFYHHLSNRQTPPQALRLAKLDEIRTPQHFDSPSRFPLQWASWVLFENPGTSGNDL